MKKNNFILRPLGIMMICLLSFANVIAQNANNDVSPKGKYNQVYTEQKSFTKSSDVYTADAAKLSTQWQNNGFSLMTVSGNQVFSTGNYLPNTVYNATSPAIQLPSISGNEKLILQVEDKFKTESRYDYLSIKASTDGGQTWNVIYKTSGQTDWRTNYLDISRFAGKSVLLSLSLNPDGTNESEGWSLKGLNIFTSNGLTGALNSKEIGTKGPAEAAQVATIDIVNIHTDDYPDAVFVDFTAKDANDQFVSGLELSDIVAYDNYTETSSCLKLFEADSAVKPSVDIFFLMDNSGSMIEEINSVKDNVAQMVNQLSSRYDVRLGFLKFGRYDNGGAPIVQVNPSITNTAFFYDTTEFLNQWATNIADGGYEPSYWAIHEGATNSLVKFRDYAEKIFVLITDESITGDGNQSQYSMQDAINVLNEKGIRLFAITPDETYFYNDFEPVCNATNGELYPEITGSFSSIFNNLVTNITNKYTLRYCPDSELDSITQTICIPVSVALKNYPNIKDTTCYFPTPTPKLVRTPSTQALDNSIQQEGIAVPVAIAVIDGNNVTGVTLHYRFNDGINLNSPFQTINLTQDQGTTTFQGNIPSNYVQRFAVEYYFVAHFPNGREVVSPTENREFFAWSFAVDPNRPPVISNVNAPAQSTMCQDIVIQADIFDNTDYLTKAKLFYRTNNSISGYVIIDMANTMGNTYRATIPRQAMDENGISYFIYAEDNYRTQGWYGSFETPKIISPISVPSSTYAPMAIEVANINGVSVACQPMSGTDTVKAYFVNDCGQLQLGGYGVNTGAMSLKFNVYGDNPNTNDKDGFDTNEQVQLKLLRGGREFNLTGFGSSGNTVKYQSNSSQILVAMIGVGRAELQVRRDGNANYIMHNDIMPSASKGTDFGRQAGRYYFLLNNNGCADMYINSIEISDTVNFTVGDPSTYSVPIGVSSMFEIEYLGTAESQATVLVYNNSDINPYKFDVRGGVAPSPTPSPNIAIHPNPVSSNETGVTINLLNVLPGHYSMGIFYNGNRIQSPLSNTYIEGNYQIFINTRGVSPGAYVVFVTSHENKPDIIIGKFIVY